MKTVKSLLVGCICLLSFSLANANDPYSKESLDKIRSTVKKLMKSVDLETIGVDHEKLKLKFLINSDNEIVVLTTSTSNKSLDALVKNRLNYKRINDPQVVASTYIIDITFKNT